MESGTNDVNAVNTVNHNLTIKYHGQYLPSITEHDRVIAAINNPNIPPGVYTRIALDLKQGLSNIKWPVVIDVRKYGLGINETIFAVKCCEFILLGRPTYVPTNFRYDTDGYVVGYEYVYGICCPICYKTAEYKWYENLNYSKAKL